MHFQDMVKDLGVQGSLNHLKELGILIKEGTEDNAELISLKYSQINSPKLNPIVQECRGLIVDEELNVVSRPFDRFFNLGETEIPEGFDFEKSQVMEKVDGSLIKVYFYKGKWRISTSGTPFAESEVNGYGITFRELFIRAFTKYEVLFNKVMNGLSPNYTYIFELCCLENRVVTQYDNDEVVLLGARRNSFDFAEVSFNELQGVSEIMFNRGANVRRPKMFKTSSLTSLTGLVKLGESLGERDEGFIVWDPRINHRIKIKTESYLRLHRLKGDNCVTVNSILELLIENEQDEFLTYFPEYTDLFTPYIREYNLMLENVQKVFDGVKHLSGKELALELYNFKPSFLVYSAVREKSTPIEVWNSKPTDIKRNFLKKYFE